MYGIPSNALSVAIAKGTFQPNMYLTNTSMAYFQGADRFVAQSIFPVCPVPLSSASYYVFDKASLLRDNVQRKPTFGKVMPAQMAHSLQTYDCKVDQIIVGIDQINALNFQRTGAPGAVDPRRAKMKFVADQMNLHQDILFAKNFFQSGVWNNEWSGAAAFSAKNKTFIKFSDKTCDPVSLFDTLCTEIERDTGRRPNRLGLGKEVFHALKNHASIIERVKFGGTTNNPATVNEHVLAELLNLEKVVVFSSIYNKAALGKTEDMSYICDPKAAILAYATDTPAIDEPSAGYIFAWDMLGDGQYMPVLQYEGENGTHTEFIEGLFAADMKKTADDLAIFLKDCV